MNVLIPTALRKHTGGSKQISVAGATVDEALRDLVEQQPDLRESLFDGSGGLVSFINVFVNDRNIRDMDQTGTIVSENDEILLVPAIAGG